MGFLDDNAPHPRAAPSDTKPTPRPVGDGQWAFRSGPHGGLAFDFAVRSDDRALGLHVETLLRSLRRDSAGATHWYSLLTAQSEIVRLYLDDTLLAELSTAGEAIEWLLWDINRSTAAASNTFLLLHAGAVQTHHGAIVFPAASGGGKSTLVAGLVRSGLGYLSDELVALSLDPRLALPYPKPITLKPGSYAFFPEAGEPETDRFSGQERSLPPEDIRAGSIGHPCQPSLVVVPRFAADEETNLRALSATEAFLSLTLNSVNLEHHGERGTRFLALMAEQCRCYELVMADLTTACGLVLQLLRV